MYVTLCHGWLPEPKSWVFGGLERVDENKWGGENDSTKIVSIKWCGLNYWRLNGTGCENNWK